MLTVSSDFLTVFSVSFRECSLSTHSLGQFLLMYMVRILCSHEFQPTAAISSCVHQEILCVSCIAPRVLIRDACGYTWWFRS